MPNGHIGGALPGSMLRVSFEFFPPKTAAMEEQLWHAVKRLEPLAPQFVSVTYGAGGTTREEIDRVVREYWDAGVRHIVALRGDPPAGSTSYAPHPGGYAYAADLVAGIRRVADFEVSVGAYPETHPEAASPDSDLDNLRRKLDAGATRAISQYFFDVWTFLRFRDRCAKAGIKAPIIPGILPVTNFQQVVKFSRMCGASVPGWLAALFDGLDEDADTRRLVAATVAAEQVRRLQEHGVEDFHFYTLNRADLTYALCHILGMRPAVSARAAA